MTKNWKPHDIKQAIQNKGWTQAQIAEQLNISRSSVSQGIRTGTPLVLREFLSELLQVPAPALFPNCYPDP